MAALAILGLGDSESVLRLSSVRADAYAFSMCTLLCFASEDEEDAGKGAYSLQETHSSRLLSIRIVMVEARSVVRHR